MEHYPKFLKGFVLAALGSVLMYGAALAVPSPTYPSFQPGSDPALASAPAATHPALDARIPFRTSDRLLARGTFRSGGSLAGNVASINTGSSRSKARYILSGMVLAALTPLAIHHFGDPGDKSVAVQTQAPGSSSLPNLGDAIAGGNGHGRGDKGNGGGGNGNSGGGGDGDGEDCDNDNGGDNGGVCDTGDHGDNGGGDNGGDCDNGGDHDSGGGGGDHGGGGGGGTSLPEPGTVPLVGAGLMMALAFRSRRNR
jgi:hypothetical protein